MNNSGWKSWKVKNSQPQLRI